MALNFLRKEENYIPDIVVRMLATVPLQHAKDIDSVVSHLMKDKEVDTSIVIAEAKQHPLKALRIKIDRNKKKYIVGYFKNTTKAIASNTNRLHLPKAYFRANVIATRTEVIIKRNYLIGKKVKFKVIPQERSVDIDTNLDFSIAEFIYKNIIKKKY